MPFETITCLVNSIIIGSSTFFLKIVISTSVPGSPLINFTASPISISFNDWSSTLIIRSPASTPALWAGVSSMGVMTLTNPSSVVISIPKPPNLPVVPIFNSLKSSFVKNEECGSKPETIPLIAALNKISSLTSSTYCSFIRLNTSTNCSIFSAGTRSDDSIL